MRLPGRLIRGPVRPDRASLARFASLRWAALPIIDRRWTAPMSAVALGFGLFVGVAIGPGTEGTLGTTNPMIVQVPAPDAPQTALAPDVVDGDGAGNGGNGQGPSADGGAGSSSDADELPSGPSAPVFDTPSTTPPITTPPITTPPITETPETDETTTDETTTDETTTDDGEEDTSGEEETAVTTVAGTVVHLNPAAASYTIATEDRRLVAIHSFKPPGIGREIEAEVKQLDNGTYFESANRTEAGRRGRAGFDGTVSFRDPVTGAYTVSAPGVSLLVRGGAQRTPPDVGELVEVEARIADSPEALPVSSPGEEGCGEPPKAPKPPRTALEQTGLEIADGERATSTDLEGVVQGVCRDSRKLILSADDLRESGHDISIAVPKDLRIAELKPGQVLKLGVGIGDAAALTLTTVAGDDGKRGAQNPALVQSGAGDTDGETDDG